MKKLITLLSSLLITFSINNTLTFAASTPPQVCEDSAVLMDATTGDILFSKNMDAAYPPASTTKTMTALLTLEQCKFDSVVTVGKNPPKIAAGTSNISLVEGEQVTVKDLLYGLIFQSGNDCAETLAEFISGTSAKFADLMNKRAKELGCENTNFVNPSGLYNINHKTSAKDLALIMRELSKHPEFKEISTQRYYVIPPNNKYPKGHPMSNESKIVNYKSYAIPGYEGSKTGYTKESLYSFTAVASRNGQRLIVSLVHGKQNAYNSETQALFNYGFDNFELVPLYKKGDKVLDYKITDSLTIPLLAADNYFFVRTKGSENVPNYSLSHIDLKDKSFKTGDKLLSLDYKLGDKNLIPLDLNSSVDYAPKIPQKKTLAVNKSSKIKYYIILILFIPILFFAYIIKKKRYRRKRYKRYQRYR
ncbi:MAG: D-alanyl-D-alanine carboxypeptidase [Clostridiaceae bacterium]|nr:D-alanyl-D-alanine carboxypeptidase [Clostridiaceae bacterium]